MRRVLSDTFHVQCVHSLVLFSVALDFHRCFITEHSTLRNSFLSLEAFPLMDSDTLAVCCSVQL